MVKHADAVREFRNYIHQAGYVPDFSNGTFADFVQISVRFDLRGVD